MQSETFFDILEERKQEQLPVVLTAAEAMDILGVGKNVMYRLLNTGAIKAVRVGRSCLTPVPGIRTAPHSPADTGRQRLGCGSAPVRSAHGGPRSRPPVWSQQ